MDEMKELMEMPPAPGPGGPPGRKPIVLPEKDWEHLTLDWDQYKDQWKKSEDGSHYELRFVYYAASLKSKNHQYMNIYVPAAYLHEDGTVNGEGICRGYTAATAPIVMYNNCGGWMSSVPGDVTMDYISEGFVHVNVGARSRDLGAEGKAPAACVDQKAAVRMLRLHDAAIPGDKEKIISCGGSGGGQMSSILGATGNMTQYYPGLWEIGAAGIEKTADGTYVSTIRDDIYASQCFCPIADIENADLAYAWQRFDDVNISYEEFGVPGKKSLSPFMLALQQDLAQAYAPYLNSLELKDEEGGALTFPRASDGSWQLRGGSYYEAILRNISHALNKWLAAIVGEDGSLTFEVMHGFDHKETLSFPSKEAYFASLPNVEVWLRKEGDTYKVTDLGLFCSATALTREKPVPGFDTFHCSAENNAFGQAHEPVVHFAPIVGKVMAENKNRYAELEGYEACDIEAYIQDTARQDIHDQTYLMNATHILLNCAKGKETSDFARFWRTRNGTADGHTGFAIAYNLCMAAKMAGAEVDYSLIWNAGHGDVDGDGTGTFVQWVHKICN